MKCSRCGINEASVHVLEVKGTEKSSYWLCTQCAAQMQGATPADDTDHGEQPEHGGGDPDLEVGSGFLLGQLFELIQGTDEEEALACPGCGLVLRQFRETNRLGCARCYEIFREQLRPLLERFQNRASHVGRWPGDGSQPASSRTESVRLRVALEEAVAREDFEEAARLRDRLRQVEAADGESGS